MKRYILDASVVLNFLLGEDHRLGRKFTKILKETKNKKAKLTSTYLLPLEVGNGLRYLLRNESVANEALQSFLDLPIEFFPLQPTHYLKILGQAYLFKTSFYDTSYHFLAKLLKATFITCDTGYFKKAKRWGDIKLL